MMAAQAERALLNDYGWLTPGVYVEKTGGDYKFFGQVVSVFKKRSGQYRCVVEDDRGILMIYNPTQLRRM